MFSVEKRRGNFHDSPSKTSSQKKKGKKKKAFNLAGMAKSKGAGRFKVRLFCGRLNSPVDLLFDGGQASCDPPNFAHFFIVFLWCSRTSLWSVCLFFFVVFFLHPTCFRRSVPALWVGKAPLIGGWG
jgi:hypothetical protein